MKTDDPVKFALAIVEEDLLSMGGLLTKNSPTLPVQFSNKESFDPSELENLLDDLTWNEEKHD